MSNALHAAVTMAHQMWAMVHGIDLSDDRGVEDSPAKMIWIAAAIIIAGLATAFAITVFRDAQEVVPAPVAPG